jgi:hypothetical protein
LTNIAQFSFAGLRASRDRMAVVLPTPKKPVNKVVGTFWMVTKNLYVLFHQLNK